MANGDKERVDRRIRKAHLSPGIESVLQDFRFGLRMLRRSPSFTAAAILTIALGIGANTTIFSMVDWLVLRPLPVREPAQLTYLVVRTKNGGYANGFSNPNLEDIRDQTSSVFSNVSGVRPFQMDGLSVDGITTPLWTNYVTGDFFEMMGIRPALGRFFLPSEGKVAGADPVLVIGYSCWQSRFGGDENVIGEDVAINGHPVKIIGVAPKGFHGALAVLDTQGYLPLGMAGVNMVARDDVLTNREIASELMILARLRPGVSLDQAQPVLEVVARRLAEQYPKIDDWASLRGRRLGAEPPSAGPSSPLPVIVGIFLSLAGLVLLLACVNITNLLMVRAGLRGREMALRAALGAGRARLMRQLLTESILLALFGCGAGIVLGLGGSRALSSINLRSAVPIALDFGFSWRVFAYAAGVAVLAGAAIGIVPALRTSRINLNEVLRESRGAFAIGRQRVRSALVVAEVGGSLMLLIVAGLFVRSLQMAQHSDLGFEPRQVLNFSMDPHEAGYDARRGGQFFQELLTKVRSVPGVQAASVAASVPMGIVAYGTAIEIDGHQDQKGERSASAAGYNAVSPQYLDSMGIPLLRGRDFLDSDNTDSGRVAIVNQAMAHEYWPDVDPIGHSFTMTADPTHPVQVVGIAKNSQTGSISDPPGPYFYVPFSQEYLTPATLQVRTAAETGSAIRSISEVIRRTEPAMPVFDVQTMTEALDSLNGLLLYKLGAGLAGALGVFGLLLAIIGVYGVISYSASQRTHEIGVRVALGARPQQVMKMVLRNGLAIVAAGLFVGIGLAAAVSKLMSALLVGVTPLDPITYASASALLSAIALVACYVPAHRAMRVDPMAALRYD